MFPGIDIVDIKDPFFKERTKRSLELISHPEDEFIEHPHLFWLFWSAKEATFKCKREAITFAPKKIPVRLTLEKNSIDFQSNEIRGSIQINEDFILAICGAVRELSHKVFTNAHEHWGEGVRFMIIEYFRELGFDYHIGSDMLNLPIVEPSKTVISLSHHGRFAAVAFPESLI